MLDYDNEIFRKYRALAITEISQLIPGKTYYGNSSKSFVLKEIIGQREMCKRHSLDFYGDENTMWLVADNDRDFSASDLNIGSSYNPWLIFESEEIAKECEKELKINHYNDFEDYDDSFDDNVNYDEDYEEYDYEINHDRDEDDERNVK